MHPWPRQWNIRFWVFQHSRYSRGCTRAPKFPSRLAAAQECLAPWFGEAHLVLSSKLSDSWWSCKTCNAATGSAKIKSKSSESRCSRATRQRMIQGAGAMVACLCRLQGDRKNPRKHAGKRTNPTGEDSNFQVQTRTETLWDSFLVWAPPPAPPPPPEARPPPCTKEFGTRSDLGMVREAMRFGSGS